MRTLEQLKFDNTYARLPEVFHERVNPTPFPNPHLVSFNPAVAVLIDLHHDEANRDEFSDYFSGARLLPGSDPIAMLYSGHQFGHYVSQLGDGRAILLGEVKNKAGETWDLHLKGAGLTRFSRDGDGRAVLRSTIREYLCSEAMHGLGIPTTRSLCITSGNETVYRESSESGAMLVRLAPSHVRFGSFEAFFYRRQHNDLKILADYVIQYHFPLANNAENPYAQLLHDVATLTGQMIAQWQAVGWSHGVMNTDNMSILGLTLDYGPYGFMEQFNPEFICNHSDHHGRYSFQNQPDIGYWNIRAIAHALSPLLEQTHVEAAPEIYEQVFTKRYRELMNAKFGLVEQYAQDGLLRQGFLNLMHESRADYTNAFRSLNNFRQDSQDHNPTIRDQFIDRDVFDDWAAKYRERLEAERSEDEKRKILMDKTNPKYILRNHLAQYAIERAEDHHDYSEIDRLLNLLSDPCADQLSMESYARPAHSDSVPIMVSCSS